MAKVPARDDRHRARRAAPTTLPRERPVREAPPRRSGPPPRHRPTGGTGPSAERSRRRGRGGGRRIRVGWLPAAAVGHVRPPRWCRRRSATDGVRRLAGRFSGDDSPPRRPYPLRRARRCHRFPRIDRHRPSGPPAGRRPRAVPIVRGDAGAGEIGGTRGRARSTPRRSSASTPSSTSPAPASATTAGPTTTSARCSRVRTGATTLLARRSPPSTAAPRRPAVRVGGRLLRRPRRRGARRASAPGTGFLADVCRGVGGEHRAGRRGRRPGRPPPHRHRAGAEGRGAGEDAAAVQVRPRRALRLAASSG